MVVVCCGWWQWLAVLMMVGVGGVWCWWWVVVVDGGGLWWSKISFTQVFLAILLTCSYIERLSVKSVRWNIHVRLYRVIEKRVMICAGGGLPK